MPKVHLDDLLEPSPRCFADFQKANPGEMLVLVHHDSVELEASRLLADDDIQTTRLADNLANRAATRE